MPSTPAIADRLNRILGNFAGIAPGESRCRADGSGVLAEVSFDDSPAGTAARLAVEHILRRGAAPRTIAPDRRLRLSLDARDGLRFTRALGYAGTECLAPGRPWQKLETVPLPTLLSHVLIAFEREYGDAGDDVPTLPIWSNVLRVFGAEALTDGELATRAVLAKRVVRVVLRDLERLAWLEPGAAGSRTARLTERARLLEAAARRRLVEVETAWRHRHGSAVIDGLRGALAEMVTSQELEWPWYLTGYGPSDPSLTGGSFLRTEPGPPRAPGRGTEWPVVPRDTSAPATGLPLSVLLSKVLAAFTIGHIVPEDAFWIQSGEFVFVAILGGFEGVLGPLLGAIAFEFIQNYASKWFPLAWQMTLGGIMLLIILFRPGGLWAIYEWMAGRFGGKLDGTTHV